MASKPVEELGDHLLALGEDTKAAALAIAARAALRTIPLLEHLPWERPLRKGMRKGLGRPRMSNSEMVSGTFRSAATAWVAARFQAFGMSDRFHEIKHDARMAGGIEDAGDTAAAYAAYAVHNAMMVATCELCEVERIVWDAAWSDFRRLENGNNSQSLIMQRLWPTSPRHFIRDDWTHLSSRLLGHADEHWSVWIDWYEAQLAGPAGLLEREEVARASLPNDVWAQGTAFANRSISGHAA